MATATEDPPQDAETTEPERHGRAHWRRVATLAWVGFSWALVVVLAGVVLTIWFSSDRLAVVTVLLQSLVPIIFLPVWVTAAFALATRRWVLAAASIALVIAHIALVVPAMGSDSVPAWAASAPTLTIFSANLFNRNVSPDAAAARVLETGADVLTLLEVSVPVYDALVRAGIDQRFPYQFRSRSSPTGDTDGVYSRRPFVSRRLVPLLENHEPAAVVSVAGRRIEIAAVHVDGAEHAPETWSAELDRLAQTARAAQGPLVIAGDFNATRWNPPFARLLEILTDAHEARGLGLSRSWPVRGTRLATFGPLMRLDHALFNTSVAVKHVHDIRVPGSDHVAFEATFAVRG
jgi:endonuclease/exonuclease/phosphatase (EEP) superfamily protein YafD